MSVPKYVVGQVVYCVMNKKNQVYPMMITEVITKRTLDGETIQYMLQAGADSSTTIMLDKLDGEVFDSADIVVDTLTQRFTSQIRRIAHNATVKAEEWYGKSRNLEQSDQIPATAYPSARPESFGVDANVVPVVMPDGSVANVKIPAGSISEDLFKR